ncbi:hypothetical protein ACEPAF_9129 [Sanghuangporus sanghuang]
MVDRVDGRKNPDDDHCHPGCRMIHCLPSEILVQIFEFAVDSDSDPWGFVIPSSVTAPLTLTWVCSSWRRTAISYSKLWISISFILHRLSSSCLSEGILDLFIRRSGDRLPFSFALNYEHALESSQAYKPSVDHLDNEKYLDSVNAIARRLIKIRHRWRRLIINVLVLEALEPFFHLLSHSEEVGSGMPMLEELSVSTKYTEFYGPHLTLPLKSCSQLRTVRILTPMVFFDPCHPLLEHLTTLDLHFCNSQQDAIVWLTCCPSLESLAIDFFASTNNNPIATSAEKRIRLPRLTYFSLTCFYGELGAEALLDSLDLPSLRAFDFLRCGLVIASPNDSAWQSIINLLTGRSEGPLPLRGLRLINAPATSSELKEILERVGGGIRYLALGGEACTDNLLEDFHPIIITESVPGTERELTSRRSEPLCPELEALELLDVNVSLASITSLTSSRAAATPSSLSLPQTANSNLGSGSSFRTLKRLALLSEKFSRCFSDQGSDSPHPLSMKSHFPEGFDVFLL